MSLDNTKQHRQLVTIKIVKSQHNDLKKILKQIAGYKSSFELSNGNSKDEIEVLIIFNNLKGSSERLLKRFLKRRNAKIVDSTKENNGFINPESKKVFVNACIFFGITMTASVFTINPISVGIGIDISFIDSVIYGLGPSIGSAVSSVIVYFKR